MEQRKLGNSNLEVSAIGLGCMRMSFGDAPVGTRQEMIAFLHAAIDRGITFFDTAEVYGPFTNEELVGRLTQVLPLTNALRPGTIWTTKATKRREKRERSPAAFVSFVPFAHFAVRESGAEWQDSRQVTH